MKTHSLNLSPEDDAEYQLLYSVAAGLRAEAVYLGDQALAKKHRQAISALYRRR